MFWINTHHVRNLLEELQCICNELKNENELAIFNKYGNNAKRCTSVLASFAICTAFIATLLPIWPQILNTIFYINESQLQNHTIQFVTEYFVDQQKYFYLILMHVNAVICIGTTTLIATGTMLLGCVIHACGLFTIASYRMEQAMATKILENINLENHSICKKIFYAVEIHLRAMKFTDLILSSFEGSFLLLIAIIVICLSLNVFAIFHNALLGNKEAFILHLLIVLVIFLYMFVANYAGQNVLNYSTHIYSSAGDTNNKKMTKLSNRKIVKQPVLSKTLIVGPMLIKFLFLIVLINTICYQNMYNVQWYNAPLHVQKMILLILQRSSKTFGLNIAGLFVVSLECFAVLTKTSMSYFTVIYTMQQ